MQLKPITAIIVFSLLVASVLTSGCSFNIGDTTPTTTTYTSPKGYAITYSSDWGKPQEQQDGSLVAFLTPTNNKTENLNVVVVNLTASDTLEIMTDEGIATAEDYDDFKLIEETGTTLAGLPAYKIVFTATIDGEQLKLLQTWTVNDGKLYIITYKGAPTNYVTHLSGAQRMIDSFQIKTVTATPTERPPDINEGGTSEESTPIPTVSDRDRRYMA